MNEFDPNSGSEQQQPGAGDNPQQSPYTQPPQYTQNPQYSQQNPYNYQPGSYNQQPPYAAQNGGYPGDGYTPYGQNPYMVRAGRGQAIASMVLGICSLVCCCAWYLAIPAAIVGVVLGALYIKRQPQGSGHGMAIAGLIMCGIAIILGAVLGILVVASINGGGLQYYLEEFENEFNSYY